MDVANASVYDGASAVAEAVLMAQRLKGRKKIPDIQNGPSGLSKGHPNLHSPAGFALEPIAYSSDGNTDLKSLEKAMSADVAAVVLQQPNIFGCLEDVEKAAGIAHSTALFSLSRPRSLCRWLFSRLPEFWGRILPRAKGRVSETD